MAEPRTRCHRCDGGGRIYFSYMAAVLSGLTLDEALDDPERVGSLVQTRPCKDCDGQGWVPGFVIPM